MTVVLYNGDFRESHEPLFTASNRAFSYGDGLFETIRVSNRRLVNIHSHLQRMQSAMELVGFANEQVVDPEYIAVKALELIDKNGIQSNARLRLEVFRNEGGYYTPDTNQASFLMTAQPLESDQFELNEKGLLIGLYDGVRLTIDDLSPFKTISSLRYVVAGHHKKDSGFDDYLLINSEGYIAEALSSNVFMVRGKTVYTPALNQGCVAGVMRRHIMRLLVSKRIRTIEARIQSEDLLNADEVFLTNSISGIKWVMGFERKRYFNPLARQLNLWLNESISPA